MTPSPEKAAPIPAVTDGFRDSAEQLKVRAASFRRLCGNMLMYGEGHAQADERYAGMLLSAATIIDRLLAYREARPPLPDSREGREPTRFPAKAAYARAMDVADRLIERAYGTSMPDEWNEAYRDVQSAVARADRARARQGGNNG